MELMELMSNSARKQRVVEELRHRLREGIDLPVLPEVANELLQLRNKASADVGMLVDVVSKDPAISTHILRYARMAGFGYGERIKTLNDAIQLVLGYDKTLHLAVGLSAGQCLPVEVDGPLGLRTFWSQSLRCAVLTQALAKELPSAYRPSLGLSYLSGLLHNIGYLLFGTLYPEEFTVLNVAAAKYEQIEIRELEFICIGISHDMIGNYLLRAWNMPDEIVMAAGEHHFPDFDGKYAIYPKLVYLANLLIRMKDDPTFVDQPWARFEKIGLNEAAAQKAQASLDEVSTELDQMAEELVA